VTFVTNIPQGSFYSQARVMDRPSKLRVATRHLARLDCHYLKGTERADYEPDVWEMYQITYRKIGLHVPRSVLLTKYPVWLICTKDGVPVFFTMFKSTRWGWKGALSGHDGTAAGKDEAKSRLRTMYHTTGFYAEMSGIPAKIALASNTPAVCNSYADDVIDRVIEPAGTDGLWYTRQLGDLGHFEKILLGRPRGVPTTNPRRPSCPVFDPSITPSDSRFKQRISPRLRVGDDEDDLDSHYACLAMDEWLAD